jgi:Outer membrane protein beta-barrel domain
MTNLMRWPAAIALVISTFGASTALAQMDEPAETPAPRFEATPWVGYRFGGSFDVTNEDGSDSNRSIDLDGDTSFGLDLGLYRDHNSFYEVLYSRQQTGVDSSDPALSGLDVNVEYLHFGGTLLFDEEYWFVPYLSLTVGATHLDPGGGYDDETKFSASLGGGVRMPFSDRVSATLGARGYLTFIGSETKLFCSSINGQGTCLLQSSGSTFFQGEAQLGLTFKF